MLEKISKSLTQFESVSIGVLLLCMSVLAFVQVITRYVFVYSVVWLEELTRYMMIWMTFLGAALAVERQDNINIDILPTLLKNKLNVNLYPVLNIFIFLFSIASIYYSFLLVGKTAAAEQMTPAMRIPMAVIYAGMMFSYILMAFHSIVLIIANSAKKRNLIEEVK